MWSCKVNLQIFQFWLRCSFRVELLSSAGSFLKETKTLSRPFILGTVAIHLSLKTGHAHVKLTGGKCAEECNFTMLGAYSPLPPACFPGSFPHLEKNLPFMFNLFNYFCPSKFQFKHHYSSTLVFALPLLFSWSQSLYAIICHSNLDPLLWTIYCFMYISLTFPNSA